MANTATCGWCKRKHLAYEANPTPGEPRMLVPHTIREGSANGQKCLGYPTYNMRGRERKGATPDF